MSWSASFKATSGRMNVWAAAVRWICSTASRPICSAAFRLSRACFQEALDGVRRPALDGAGVVVARQATLHHDPVAGQPPHQLRIPGGRAAVADALGAQLVHRLPHVLRGRIFARVHGQPQLAQARDLVRALEQARGIAFLRARDVEADHAQAGMEMLRFRNGLAGQDLRDVRAVLAHRDHDEAQPHAVVPARGVVHPGEHGADRLAGREAGERVDDRRVAQLQRLHPRRRRLVDDGLRDLRDVLVELGNPERVVHLVEVGEQRAFLFRLELEPGPHLRERLHRVETVVTHELPGHLGRDRPVHVLVQLDLGQGTDASLHLRGRHGRAPPDQSLQRTLARGGAR